MKPETLRKLSALGLNVEQIAGVMEIMAEDAEEGKEKARERWRRWKSKLNLSAAEWIAVSTFVKERDNYTCGYCGSRLAPLHCDHIVPLAQGGTNDLDNLVTACRECNCGKSGRTPEQWRRGA